MNVRNELSEAKLVIQTRSDFDEFWASGIEIGQVTSLEALNLPIEHSSISRLGSGAPDTASSVSPSAGDPIGSPPITAQVWWKYATTPLDQPLDLLIDPGAASRGSTRQGSGISSGSAVRLIERHCLDGAVSLESTQLAEGFGYIALSLPFRDMVTRLLGLTSWQPLLAQAKKMAPAQRRTAMCVYRGIETPRPASAALDVTDIAELKRMGWFLHLLAICAYRDNGSGPGAITYDSRSPAIRSISGLLKNARLPDANTTIGRVTLNRPAMATVRRSQRAVKADGARGLFDIRCDTIRWAIVDSGIDARHDWFRLPRPDGMPWPNPFNNGAPSNYTRIVESYDFARQRTSSAVVRRRERGENRVELPGDVPIAMWEDSYEPPRNGHGTHVAGIIGGTGGLCPDIRLFDYRVLDQDGKGNEFAILSALRYILDTTHRASRADPTGRNRDLPIHGVNLSVALDADVTSDACGWSLVCRVCDELVRAGIVLVVAAGNTGFEDRTGTLISTGQNYRTLSITDPGNTERVITVGSTDADRPHEYGISYFSARGPTADGRPKPDLVAPGNSIMSAYGYRRDDEDRCNVAATLNGTSMAAAHVSGCAALLLARHRELIGKPDEVKRILMSTATDLGRDRNFQGAGLVDALRAIQSS